MIRILSAVASLLVTAVLTAVVAAPALPSITDPGRANGQSVCYADRPGAGAGMKTPDGRAEAAADTGSHAERTSA